MVQPAVFARREPLGHPLHALAVGTDQARDVERAHPAPLGVAELIKEAHKPALELRGPINTRHGHSRPPKVGNMVVAKPTHEGWYLVIDENRPTASILNAPYFQDVAAAYAKLESIVWPNGAVCPHCGSLDKMKRMGGKATRRASTSAMPAVSRAASPSAPCSRAATSSCICGFRPLT